MAVRHVLPWWRVMALAQAATEARRHWNLLSPAERRELQRLVRKSRGRPWNLDAKERASLRRLVEKLELLVLGRTLAALASPLPWRRAKGRRR